jgi:predicted small metal-binding protein
VATWPFVRPVNTHKYTQKPSQRAAASLAIPSIAQVSQSVPLHHYLFKSTVVLKLDLQKINCLSQKELDMKTMTCKQLGGACDVELQANSFKEIAELSKKHGTEMHHQKEPKHLESMHKMQELIRNPESMKERMESKKKLFSSLPSQ